MIDKWITKIEIHQYLSVFMDFHLVDYIVSTCMQYLPQKAKPTALKKERIIHWQNLHNTIAKITICQKLQIKHFRPFHQILSSPNFQVYGIIITLMLTRLTDSTDVEAAYLVGKSWKPWHQKTCPFQQHLLQPLETCTLCQAEGRALSHAAWHLIQTTKKEQL